MIADPLEPDLLAERSELSIDELFSLLADPQRRIVIERLDRTSSDVTIEVLADHVVAELNDGTLEAAAERRRALFALHHNHLPRLDDHGILEYDPAAGIVTVS